MKLNSIQTFYAELVSLVSNHTGPILITSHKQADPDALGSAILAYYLLKTSTSNVISIVLPTKSKQTERILATYSLASIVRETLDSDQSPDKYAIVLVDTNQPAITDLELIFQQEDSVEVFKQASLPIIIDHHLPSEDITTLAKLELILANYSSASELLLDLVVESKIEIIDKTILAIGLTGILFDTKRLLLAGPDTLRRVQFMLEILGGTIEDYLFVLDNQKDYSERVANVKAAQRNKLVILEEKYLLSLSFVSSFESSSARALQYLGSDITAVINSSKKEIRISFRATKKFHAETGLHCGELAQYLAEKYTGTGSGHPTAAGCNLPVAPVKKTNNELFDEITMYATKHVATTTHTNKE